MNNITLTLNLQEDSIFLSQSVLEALDWPRQVQLLINNEEKMLLLRSCTIEDVRRWSCRRNRPFRLRSAAGACSEKSDVWSDGTMTARESAAGSISRRTRRSGLT